MCRIKLTIGTGSKVPCSPWRAVVYALLTPAVSVSNDMTSAVPHSPVGAARRGFIPPHARFTGIGALRHKPCPAHLERWTTSESNLCCYDSMQARAANISGSTGLCIQRRSDVCYRWGRNSIIEILVQSGDEHSISFPTQTSCSHASHISAPVDTTGIITTGY